MLEGAIAHKDSTGGGGVIRPGEVQYMAAGTGVTHSEYNASSTEPLHLLQIWIAPKAADFAPRYAQRSVADVRDNALGLVASGDGRDGSIAVNQDVSLYAARLDEGRTLEHRFAAGRFGWLQLARGGLEISGVVMQAGDGARVEREEVLGVKSLADGTEFLLFDLN